MKEDMPGAAAITNSAPESNNVRTPFFMENRREYLQTNATSRRQPCSWQRRASP
jgi:hypothetical protein